jgi:Zn-dependent protease
MENIYEPIVWYIVFLFSVTLHEAAHAFIAKKGGDETAYLGGQVSLDPLPHIRRSPFGMVFLPLLSVFLVGWPIGFASAPYDPFWADQYPRRAGYMALAGPASNFALVVFAGLSIRLGILFGAFKLPPEIQVSNVAVAAQPGFWSAAAFFIGIVFTLNLVLTVLNMLPIPPLDGSGVLTLLLSENNARKYNAFFRNPMFSMIGILLVWRIFAPIFRVFFRFAISLLYPEASYISKY